MEEKMRGDRAMVHSGRPTCGNRMILFISIGERGSHYLSGLLLERAQIFNNWLNEGFSLNCAGNTTQYLGDLARSKHTKHIKRSLDTQWPRIKETVNSIGYLPNRSHLYNVQFQLQPTTDLSTRLMFSFINLDYQFKTLLK